MSKKVIADFYRKHLANGVEKENILSAPCPFCTSQSKENQGKIIVFLNKTSLFFGYFRCLSGCMENGYVHWFASLAGISSDELPVVNDADDFWHNSTFPNKNINVDIDGYIEKAMEERLSFFEDATVGKVVIRQLHVGFNGRYLVYPYKQIDGNIYSARCVHPDKNDDYFWYGDTEFAEGTTGLFNIDEIKRCAGGALFLCEGEENLLPIKQMGFPGVAYWDKRIIEKLDPEVFAPVSTVFIVPRNNHDSYSAAKVAATKIGYKVRILKWSQEYERDYSLYLYAVENKKDLTKHFGNMVQQSRPFSPFSTPEREHYSFLSAISEMAGEQYSNIQSGFTLLDDRLGGIHGINILGGGPKVGKSCFMIQIATTMAANGVPVLYYDFENGRQRIYQRTFIRMSRLENEQLLSMDLSDPEKKRYETTKKQFRQLLNNFRVVNDRKLSPEIMKRHIDFLRHETQNEYTVVVIDSLHKLPFKDLSEMRTGIDSWLRQFESIRDQLNVSFLIISELSRGEGGKYTDNPHMGAFKGSGDIEYSADNAMVLLPDWDHMKGEMDKRNNALWLVGSREHRPGLVGSYILDYPYWGFIEGEEQ